MQISGMRIVYMVFFFDDKIPILFLNAKYNRNTKINKIINNDAGKNN